MKNKPPYAIQSVDHALYLAQILQLEGPIRVTEAAERLGVSPSTAHRLLAMLIYRDFAQQDSDRRYRPGNALRQYELSEVPIAMLRHAALPRLRELADQVQESTNLMVLTGSKVRFVATVECDQVLRVGDRSGRVLPAEQVSGGKAILASMPTDAIEPLFQSSPDVDLTSLKRSLALVRKRGFAINDQATETGLTAIGVALNDSTGRTKAAISIAMPTARFHRDRLTELVDALTVTARRIQHNLATSS